MAFSSLTPGATTSTLGATASGASLLPTPLLDASFLGVPRSPATFSTGIFPFAAPFLPRARFNTIFPHTHFFFLLAQCSHRHFPGARWHGCPNLAQRLHYRQKSVTKKEENIRRRT